jgi:hypothetical protein
MHVDKRVGIGMRHTGKSLGFLRRHCPQMPQIALVSHEHDNDVAVGVVTQLLQPPRDILVRLVLADVIHEQCPHSSAVVGGGDGSVSLLAGCVPDLSLDGFGVDLDRAGGELDADCGL